MSKLSASSSHIAHSFTAIGSSESQRRLRLRLEAEGCPHLFPLLEEAVGAILLERFRLDGLLAVGRQSFLFAATELSSGRPVVVKQPAFDYSKPVLYNRAAVNRARRSLLTEHAVLSACTTCHLPTPIALFTTSSPISAARESPLLATSELFLVEERIQGHTLTQLALEVWPSLTPEARETGARQIACSFVQFWQALHATEWHYGDISADNLLLEQGSGSLRVVDGGSAVPAGNDVILTGYTPAFTTPRLFAALSSSRPVPGNLASVFPPLAKALHFALTRQEPFNGNFPSLEHPALTEYSPQCRIALANLLILDDHPQSLSLALESLASWTTGSLPPSVG